MATGATAVDNRALTPAVAAALNDVRTACDRLAKMIDSLRKTRRSMLCSVAGLDDRERQMDADGALLLSSTEAALEEHERLKAKLARLKRESRVHASAQLREAKALEEALAEVRARRKTLEARLETHRQQEMQRAYLATRAAREAHEANALNHGILRSRIEQWRADLGRIAEATRVDGVAEGEKASVERVVAIYRDQEAANTSLFKMLTEHLKVPRESLQAELTELEAEAEALEAARRRADEATERMNALEAQEQEMDGKRTERAERVQRTLAQIVRAFEGLGDAIELELPAHGQEKKCSLGTLDE